MKQGKYKMIKPDIIMSYDQVLKMCPDIAKIDRETFVKFASLKTGDGNFVFNKTFEDQGFDDLDCVELIMDLERELNIVINDDIAEQIVSGEIMPNLFLSEWRNDKIDKIING